MIPWGYRRAFRCCFLLFLLGTLVQLIFGPVPQHLLHYPWSVVAALVYVYALVVVDFLSGKHPRLRRLSDPYNGFASIASFAGLCILFGLLPQSPDAGGPAALLGWTDMRSCWAFNFLMLWMMTGIGLSVVAGIRSLKSRPLASTLSHLAVFLVLLGGFFGNGDKQEVLVRSERGIPVAIGEDGDGQSVQIPFMLLLDDFTIEEYPVDSLGGASAMGGMRFPKRFLSEVTILTKEGRVPVEISVNHPVRKGPWRIYQYGYDVSRGGESEYSDLLCVKDGWYPLIAGGLWLLLAAGLLMFFTAGGSRKKKEVKP